MQFHPGIQELDDFKNNMLPQILSDFSKEDNFVIIQRDNILSSLKKYHDYLLKLHEEGAKILEIK